MRLHLKQIDALDRAIAEIDRESRPISILFVR
jgi:hypothetical protein